MKIDLEQFLALTVALGAVGAVGVGVYVTRTDADEIVESIAAQGEAEEQQASAAAAVPLPAAPTEHVADDEALSPVVPDADPLEAYGPEAGAGGGGGGGWGGGPDVETPEW